MDLISVNRRAKVQTRRAPLIAGKLESVYIEYDDDDDDDVMFSVLSSRFCLFKLVTLPRAVLNNLDLRRLFYLAFMSQQQQHPIASMMQPFESPRASIGPTMMMAKRR